MAIPLDDLDMDKEIFKLQDNLFIIRYTGGWSQERFANLLGVTKQTISNWENKKVPMNKCTYIAIRTILEYEIANYYKQNALLDLVMKLCLDPYDISDDDKATAITFLVGVCKTDMPNTKIIESLKELIGEKSVHTILSDWTYVNRNWLSNMLEG